MEAITSGGIYGRSRCKPRKKNMHQINEVTLEDTSDIRPLCIGCDQEELLAIVCEKGGGIFVNGDEGPAENIVSGGVEVPVHCTATERKIVRKILKNLAELQAATQWRELQ